MELPLCEGETGRTNAIRSVNSLFERDQQLLHMEEMIKQKKEFLMKRHQYLQKALKQNKFLETVKNDYSKYYNYIAEEKRRQIAALETLNNYIQRLNETNEISRYNIEDSKVEQKKIINEISSIKKGLSKIMNGENK